MLRLRLLSSDDSGSIIGPASSNLAHHLVIDSGTELRHPDDTFEARDWSSHGWSLRLLVFATILGEALPLQSLNEPPPVARGVPYVPIRYEQCGKCKMSNLRTQLVDESQKHRGVEVLTRPFLPNWRPARTSPASSELESWHRELHRRVGRERKVG